MKRIHARWDKDFSCAQGILNDGQIVGHDGDPSSVRLSVEEVEYCAFMLPRVCLDGENERPALVDVETAEDIGNMASVKIAYRFKNAPVIYSKMWVVGGMRPTDHKQELIRKNWKEVSYRLTTRIGSVFDFQVQRPKFNRCPVFYSQSARRFLALIPQIAP